MWIAAALAATALLLARKLGLRGPNGEATSRTAAVVPPVVLVAALAVALAQTVVVGVLSLFAHDLQVDAVGATWLLTAFMLASAVTTPIAGRLGDQYGHHRLILVGLLLLLAGSVVAAISTDHGWYAGALSGRVLQGLAGGVFPCTFGLARQLVPSRRLPGVVAGLSAMFGVGGAAGMVAAGPLVDASNLAAVFWLVAGLAVVALIGTLLLPAPRPTASRTARPDLLGGVLLAATLVALLLAVSQGRTWGWSSLPVLGLACAAVVLGALFVLVEQRAAAPLVDLRLLVGRQLLAINAVTVVIGVGMFAAVTLLPLFAQTPAHLGYGFGYSPSRSGLLIAPIGLFMVIAAPLTPRLARGIGARAVFQVGAMLAAVGLAGLAFLHDQPMTVALSGAVLGLAYGFAFGSLGSLVVDAAAVQDTGTATGINTILRTVGGAIGSAIAVSIVAGSAKPGTTAPTESGYTTAFAASALVALTAVALAAAVRSSSSSGRASADLSA
ncbi:MFS transporter [Kribbella speibonae]|uniref:MFS transporter n=1 Tax=Kribbella speibonae TaxID=1572660 RepID=A0A4R0II19_9ACTN|nr:MFS transporter [Kribbella speibonae]TCC30856.1 MFS transporter [Kribbella speibonae]